LRLDAAAFKRAVRDSPPLQRQLNRYLYVLMTQLAQSTARTRFPFDRGSPGALAPHDAGSCSLGPVWRSRKPSLAGMLGVLRAGVPPAANALQARSLIAYDPTPLAAEVRADRPRGDDPSREAGASSCVQAGATRLRQAYGDRGQDREVSETKSLAAPLRLVLAIKVSGSDG
jgi:hypothetical protein